MVRGFQELVLVALVAAMVLVVDVVRSCPHGCFCYRTNVRCMFLNLETIPNVPADTTVLDLRFNKLKRIPRGSFPLLPSLSTLLLNNNELEKLEEGSFEGLPHLRYLYLHKNKIREILPKAFMSIPKLEQLFLHNNALSQFPDGIFADNHSLRRLRLDSNALVCDCGIMWLADMLKEQHGHTQATVTCQHPRQLQGRSLMTIAKEDFHCEKPRITMEPRSVDVTFGNTAYFSCRAEGDPVPEISWLHNENEINPNAEERYSILDDGTLMIEQARDDDQGAYECIARNTAGSAKTAKAELRYFDNNGVHLLVGGPDSGSNIGPLTAPRFVEVPNDVTIVEGEDLYLPCKARGSPEPRISWTVNGDSINANIRIRQLVDGALTITNARMTDAGQYRCTASSSLHKITADADVRILVRPVITRTPVDTSAFVGTDANFTCEASSASAAVLTWNKDGLPLRNNGRYEIQRNGEILRIRGIVVADQGVYTCRAENAAGQITAQGRLQILRSEVPTFNERSELVTALVGTQITLRCMANGRPSPIYDWMREGRVIQNRNRFSLHAGELTVSNIHLQDAGRYDCIAENVAGRATKSIYLQIHGQDRSRPGDRFVSNAIPQARTQVNFAVNETLTQLFDRSKTHGVQDLLTAFRYPSPEALDLARAEEVFEKTLEIIHQHVNEGHRYNLSDHEASYQELVSPAHLLLIANMSGCLRRTHNIDCSDSCFNRKYRSFDGTCNNFQNPEWGASNTAFNRLLPAIYENGFNMPVGWNSHKLYRNTHLPSARLVSSLLLSTDTITNDDLYTHMLMQWGQFVDHDMTLAPQSISYARFSDGRRCNETCDKQAPCFPIPVPASDPRIRDRQCLGFTRTSATCNSGSTSLFYNTLAPRQQLNALTSFIDASNVYGNTERMAINVRNLASDRGLLREGAASVGNKRLLPFEEDHLEHIDCQIEPSKRHVPCFLAGDPRANEQLALTAMHTLWMRYHNHIATVLDRINPHWDGNKIFHEARKIVGAMMQHITYTHWLEKVIGQKGMAMMGAYDGYKPDVNPSIVNEFAVAALRFGHTLVQPVIFRLNETFQEIPQGHLPLHQAFFAPYKLVEEGGVDPLIRGLFATATKKRMPGEFFNSELTERLFKLANAIGQDLASLNIQRGRDHGIQFYNDYREHCGLSRANTFEDLRGEIQHRSNREKLRSLYGHPEAVSRKVPLLAPTSTIMKDTVDCVKGNNESFLVYVCTPFHRRLPKSFLSDNIDLFIGGLSETLVDGAKVGPTFLCILSDQFKRVRDGDRFWYERDGIFTAEQLVSIKRMSMSTVICQSSDNIQRVQKDVFLRVNDEEDYVSCSEIPQLDIRQWTDCCEDCRTRATLTSFPRRLSRGRRSVDQSYPEDRPQNLNFDEEEDVEYLDAEDEESTETSVPVREQSLPEEDTSASQCLKEDMDLMEERIEGMEEVMMEMSHIIKNLKRKVKTLERSQPLRQHSCRDDKNRFRYNGQRWKMDGCTSCICKNSEIVCSSTGCDQETKS